MSKKTVILGMNNPHSEDPSQCLLPDVPGSSGYRLWQMSGMAREAYLTSFERRNVLNRLRWTMDEASATAETLRGELSGRTVVVLGTEVWNVVVRTQSLPCSFLLMPGTLTTYWFDPHPSGLNHWSNEKRNRRARGRLRRRLAA